MVHTKISTTLLLFMYPLSFGINYYKLLQIQTSTEGVGHADVTYVIASFPGPFETLEDGPGNEAGYRITKWHVSEMKAVSTQ